MQFSFIIPMLNEERNIGRCLNSLFHLNLPKDEYEIIVVDNGSIDSSCSIVESFANRMTVQLLRFPDLNISALRNKGAIIAQGRFLGFIDADCTVPPDWATHVEDYLQNPKIGVVGCTYKVPKFSWVACSWDLNNAKRRRLGRVAFVPAGCLAVSKEFFSLVKGFDEQLVTNEDCDFCFRMKSKDKEIWSVPDAAVVHWGVSKSLWEFFKRQRWHGKDVLRVFFKDFRASKNLKAVLYAMYYFVAMVGIIFFLFYYYFTGSINVGVLFLLGVVMPPIILSIRSLKGMNIPHKFSQFFKLWLLYLVYGLARASCIVSGANISSRKKVTEKLED